MICNGCQPSDESNGYCPECVRKAISSGHSALPSEESPQIDKEKIGDALIGLEATGGANGAVMLYCELIRTHGAWKRSHLYLLPGQVKVDPVYVALLKQFRTVPDIAELTRAQIMRGFNILLRDPSVLDVTMDDATHYEATGELPIRFAKPIATAYASSLGWTNDVRQRIRVYLDAVCEHSLSKNMYHELTLELTAADYGVCRVCDAIVSGQTLTVNEGCCSLECVVEYVQTVARKPGESDDELRKRARKVLDQRVQI